MHNRVAVSARRVSAGEPKQAEGSGYGQQHKARRKARDYGVAVQCPLIVDVSRWRIHALHSAGVNANLCRCQMQAATGAQKAQRSSHADPATCMDDNDMLTHIVWWCC